MNKETLRMQMLAGIITESQYKAKLQEFKELSWGDEIYYIVIDAIEESNDDYLKLAMHVGGILDDITTSVENIIKPMGKYNDSPFLDEELRSIIEKETRAHLDAFPPEEISSAEEQRDQNK
jgi:hypothetical protein